jgi:hypothetical protein
MIYFKDFFPQIVNQGGFFSEDNYENVSEIVNRVNEWLTKFKDKFQVINIETVILPLKETEESSFLRDQPYSYQFLRVWYQDK